VDGYHFYHKFVPYQDLRGPYGDGSSADNSFIGLCYQTEERLNSEWECIEHTFPGDFAGTVIMKIRSYSDSNFPNEPVSRESDFNAELSFNPYLLQVGKAVLSIDGEENFEAANRFEVDRILRGRYKCTFEDTNAEWIGFTTILMGGVSTVVFTAATLASVVTLAF